MVVAALAGVLLLPFVVMQSGRLSRAVHGSDNLADRLTSVQEGVDGLREQVRGLPTSSMTEVEVGPTIRVSINNRSGVEPRDLGEASQRFCFLVGVGFQDVDAEDELGLCQVLTEGDRWVLTARLQSRKDADAYCEARCVSWR